MADQAEKSDRLKQIEERKARMTAFAPQREARVRVNPANEDIRKAISHPSGNLKFPASGSVEWPLDQFTKRRLRDGSVTREGGEKAKAPPPPPKAS